MSADLASSNPFRRKTPAIPSPLPPTNTPDPDSLQISYENVPIRSSSIADPSGSSKRAGKKVRVQSPPPPSPHSSPIKEERPAGYSTLATETIRGGDDPFDSNLSHSSEEDVADTWRQVPANPFAKTLATIEPSESEGPGISVIGSPGRAPMDVEAFKRLLMTGNAGLGTPASPPPVPAHTAHHVLGDAASSTDTSSISRQSIFEGPHEVHTESPRTSHEISDREEDVRGSTVDSHLSRSSSRKKPPPPSSRHGRLIRVELRDDHPSNKSGIESPSIKGPGLHQIGSSSVPSTPSQTDLNKPLPPAPSRRSHDSDRESVFDKESAGKTPEPPSPSEPVRREKMPLPPPVTRRHSHLISDSKLSRSNSGRLSPNVEEDERANSEEQEDGRPRSNSGRAPPPPPSRRPASIRRASSHLSPSPSASTTSLPAPPPARRLSRKSSTGRPSSIRSLEIATNSKRLSVIPPPPPPRARNSLDEQTPEKSYQHCGEQVQPSPKATLRDSRASSVSTVNPVGEEPVGHDILADLTALQREIDALRVQSNQ
ncbi:hypothetical protein GLAREA_04653 [Glarea lozoyensis ATCC 20868]|uniref:Uncharacterized protein n=1 Tax=Glarea lozoyensis (strain ATCC 20868 / MF5171) TaxID=1116229 RepID=S3CN20_GLAL2|nr:uncharacterized protein GLAREA_04653 [Glarea lozoyensis ATCC 20868]EPE27862.1 hypothetical protein GLAREA_04653 [Glarea lozoyensis ATCC 20868]